VVLGLVALTNCVGEAYGRAVLGENSFAASGRVDLTAIKTERSGQEMDSDYTPAHAAFDLPTTCKAAKNLLGRSSIKSKGKSSKSKTKPKSIRPKIAQKKSTNNESTKN
jgi:hypothetical protein